MVETGPPVQVQEVTKGEIEKLRKDPPSGVNLGGAHSLRAACMEEDVDYMINRIRDAPGTRCFLLVWEGSNIPRGAKILHHEVAWTQNGMVNSTNDNIGVYTRLKEMDGKKRMIVYVHPKFSREL